jgi:uncharacterized membrane protein (UPF0127 family)
VNRFDGSPTHELDGGHRIVVADSRRARMKGLSDLPAMPPATGLHIPRCRSIQTVSMRFALDLIWLDRHGAVVRIDEAVPPKRMKTCLRARSVVECDAGSAGDFVAAGIERIGL